MALGVATYNIHRCIGSDRRYDAARVVGVLRELECEVIALQEVENRSDERHDSLQLDYLAESLRMQAIAGLSIIRHWGPYGNALLTRLPVRQVSLHNLSVTWREPRGAIEATLERDGNPLRVIATHLGLGRQERRHQTMQLVKLVRAVPDVPCIVLGDMNEWLPSARHLRWLHEELGASEAPRSFPVWWPKLRLDRIWAGPAPVQVRSIGAHLSASSRYASDHLPVKALVDFGGDL